MDNIKWYTVFKKVRKYLAQIFDKAKEDGDQRR